MLALAGRAGIEVGRHSIGGTEETRADGQDLAIPASSTQAGAAVLQMKSRKLVRFMSR
ncbi:hypothetical protein [Streptomyces sp. C36]|uniref:hypothetical protein n=1 Tax=Streptomyces sp. C36 TaxID=3237122 RepID=UPI0034C6AF22